MARQDAWLTVGEMADVLRVHVNTARNWVDAGTVLVGDVEYPLESYRLPGRAGHRRVRRSHVEAIAKAMFGETA